MFNKDSEKEIKASKKVLLKEVKNLLEDENKSGFFMISSDGTFSICARNTSKRKVFAKFASGLNLTKDECTMFGIALIETGLKMDNNNQFKKEE